MFHVKHNDKDNIIHVHIGDRTLPHAHAHAHIHASDAPADKQPVGQAAVTVQAIKRASGQSYIGRLFIYMVSFYIYRRQKTKKGGLTASSVHAII